MYQASVPRAKTAMAASSLALVLGEQPGHRAEADEGRTTQGRRSKQGSRCGMVRRAVDAEAVPLAGDVHQRLDRGQVGGSALAHGHALALGQADVVAPLGLHPRPGSPPRPPVRSMWIVLSGWTRCGLRLEAVARHPRPTPPGDVGQLRLDLEQGGVRLLAERARHGEHGAAPGRAQSNPPPGPWARTRPSGPRASGGTGCWRPPGSARPGWGWSAARRVGPSSRTPTSVAPSGRSAGCGHWGGPRRNRPTQRRRHSLLRGRGFPGW